MMPTFVRITTEDYKAAGELAGIQANKQQAVEFYHRNGAGHKSPYLISNSEVEALRLAMPADFAEFRLMMPSPSVHFGEPSLIPIPKPAGVAA